MRRVAILFFLMTSFGLSVYGQSLDSVPAGKCRIVFYASYWSPVGDSMGNQVHVTIDDQKTIDLIPKNLYVVFDLEPGHHSIKTSWDSLLKTKKSEFLYSDSALVYVSAGKTVYAHFLINNGKSPLLIWDKPDDAKQYAKRTALHISIPEDQ